jgi:4-amino-4-deoxy-L-arabinose transferase-like glycosyltransferase
MFRGCSLRTRGLWIAVVLAGIVLRLAFVWRPVDYRVLNSWRECDYACIARSFATEGMNIFYPRVDWRGDTSGYAEMELPVLPWTAALMYKMLGYHEVILRLLSALCSIGSLLAFCALARRILPGNGALVASACFAANGLLIALSGAAQPEPLQLLFVILAVNTFVRWIETESTATLLLTSVFTAVAILAKSPSAYLGLLFLYAGLRTKGSRILRQPVTYVALLVAVVPPLLWYLWSHGLYASTGLSLGVSNESHFIRWELLSHPVSWIRGNIATEWQDVFAGFGVVFVVSSFIFPWKQIEIPAAWYASVVIFYIAIAGTSGDPWAYYYHSNSLPPACLLIGFGYEAVASREGWFGGNRGGLWFSRSLARVLLVCMLLATLVRGFQLELASFASTKLKSMYLTCQEFKQKVPAYEMIVARGGPRLDEYGHPVAYNQPLAFAWMDRKGFNYAEEDYSCDALAALARRGGRYWLVDSVDRANKQVFAEISHSAKVLAHSAEYDLLDLLPLSSATKVNPGGL